MQLVSFNINSIRARIHQLEAIIEKYQPEFIALQETKVHDEQFPHDEINRLGYKAFTHGQKAHYGVAILSKQLPIRIQKGFVNDDELSQRRFISATYLTNEGKFTLLNGYFPQGESADHPIKFPAKAKFYRDLTSNIEKMDLKNELVALVGDMNICPKDNDIGLKPENKNRWLQMQKCAFLPEERVWLNDLMKNDLHDSFRLFHPNIYDRFSWFDYRSKGFLQNIGLRIDLILINSKLAKFCQNSNIDYEIREMEKPSDHAPIFAKFNLSFKN